MVALYCIELHPVHQLQWLDFTRQHFSCNAVCVTAQWNSETVKQWKSTVYCCHLLFLSPSGGDQEPWPGPPWYRTAATSSSSSLSSSSSSSSSSSMQCSAVQSSGEPGALYGEVANSGKLSSTSSSSPSSLVQSSSLFSSLPIPIHQHLLAIDNSHLQLLIILQAALVKSSCSQSKYQFCIIINPFTH